MCSNLVYLSSRTGIYNNNSIVSPICSWKFLTPIAIAIVSIDLSLTFHRNRLVCDNHDVHGRCALSRCRGYTHNLS